jgi:hypothetical protein
MRRNLTFGDDQNAAPPQNYLGQRVPAGYDELHADEFDASVVDPGVDFLARLTGHGDALEVGSMTSRRDA